MKNKQDKLTMCKTFPSKGPGLNFLICELKLSFQNIIFKFILIFNNLFLLRFFLSIRWHMNYENRRYSKT